MKTSFVHVLSPHIKNVDAHGRTIVPRITDYIVVPRLTTIGTFQVVDLLPFETLAGLSQLRDQLAGVKS